MLFAMNRLSPKRLITVLLPLLELAVFIVVGNMAGFGFAILLMIATSVWGTSILRNGGISQVSQFMQHWQQGNHQLPEGVDKFITIVCGVLLLLPGFITDVIGVLLLIPNIRKFALDWLQRKGILNPKHMSQTNAIDAEYWHEDEK